MHDAAEMLRRIRGELGITIVWVEHIMALCSGWWTAWSCSITARRSQRAPREVAENPQVIEAYLARRWC